RVDLGPRGQVVDGHLEFLEDLDQLGELFPGQLVALPLGDREAQPVRRGDREELDALPHRLHRAVQGRPVHRLRGFRHEGVGHHSPPSDMNMSPAALPASWALIFSFDGASTFCSRSSYHTSWVKPGIFVAHQASRACAKRIVRSTRSGVVRSWLKMWTALFASSFWNSAVAAPQSRDRGSMNPPAKTMRNYIPQFRNPRRFAG